MLDLNRSQLAATGEPTILIRGLSRYYGSVRALEGVSISLEQKRRIASITPTRL